MGPCQCSGRTPRPLGHHRDDQEAQECPPNGDFYDFGCLDGDFVTVILHMIPFWNP